MTLRHPFVALDNWWDTKSGQLRLDHNLANLCMLLGLVCSSLSIIILGPSPSSALKVMPPSLQIEMCVCIFTGCLLKLHGVFSRSRFWFSRMTLKRCYQLGYNGAPIAAAGLFVYGGYILDNTPTWTSALGGVLTPLLGVGILGQGCVYWLEARRLERVEGRMITFAKHLKENRE